jgi:hypothetical protein
MSKPHRRATVTVAPTTAQRGNGGIQQLGRDSTPNPEHRRRACPHGDPVSPRRGWRGSPWDTMLSRRVKNA